VVDVPVVIDDRFVLDIPVKSNSRSQAGTFKEAAI
jgi:hypothetical protein